MDIIDIIDNSVYDVDDIPIFYCEKNYSDWFIENLVQFDYESAETFNYGLAYKHSCNKQFKGFRKPDLICKRIGSNKYDVLELELFPSRFIDHKHHIDDVDWIYCADDNRIFYPDFPKEISAKLKITNTKASACGNHMREKSWAIIEKRYNEYIKNKNNIKTKDERDTINRMINVLGWFSDTKKCIKCNKILPIHMNKNITDEHENCLISFIDEYLKIRGERKNYEHIPT